MSIKDKYIDRFLEFHETKDTINRYANYRKRHKGCEQCGRIKYTRTCECILNAEAKVIARRFR